MKNGFDGLANWVNEITQGLDDNEKRKLTRKLASKLRQHWRQRIRSQKDPDGQTFTPRKNPKKRDQRGRIKRGAMFRRLPKLIKTAYSSNHTELGFHGRTAKIVETHHYGLTAQPSKMQDPVRYPVRELVGFSEDDIQLIKETIREFMSGA